MDTKRAGRILRELETILIHIRVATTSHKSALNQSLKESTITEKRIKRDQLIIEFNTKKREL